MLPARITAMHQLDFNEAVEHLITNDPRYDRDAYYFLREALEYTQKLRKRSTIEGGHVTGQQLCDGIRQYALKQYGPMVPTVLEYWGITKTDDFGEMVWNMIDLGVFGKTPNDTKEDFKVVYQFHDAFVAPFLPEQSPTRNIKPNKPGVQTNK
jgi:uncharacterized repeat protein (TIGR04138 family)